MAKKVDYSAPETAGGEVTPEVSTKVNFKKAKEATLPVDPTEVDAILSKYEFTKARNGSGLLKVQWTVEGGPHDGRIFFDQYSLKEDALWALFRDLVTLGVDPDDLDEDTELRDIVPGLVGARAHLIIGINEYTRQDGTTGRNNSVERVLESSARAF